MRKLLKVILPSIFFLAFGISLMVAISSCAKDPGEKCAKCSSNSDCNDGLSCMQMSNGQQRCGNVGDVCVGLK